MKKVLLLLIAMVCSVSVFAADMKQCKNCGEWFNGDATIGYDYCRRNACQKVRHREEGAAAQASFQAELRYLQSQANKKKLIEKFGEYLIKAKKEKISTKAQLNVIATVYKKYNTPYVWQQIIYYSSMEVIKACWPMADSEDIMRKSSAAEAQTRPPLSMYSFDSVITVEKNLHAVARLPLRDTGRYSSSAHLQSIKQIGCAFALGRHQKTGKTRFVENINANSIQYLIWAAEAGRTDVLEWFFKQMDGADTTTLCALASAYAEEVKMYDQQKQEFEKEIKALEKQKNDAADKFQEKEIAKKISAVKAEMAEIPSKPDNGYEDVIKTVIKNTDAKVFDEFVSIISDYFNENKKYERETQPYKNTALDFLKYNAKGKKAIKNYEAIGYLVWKSGIPNVKKIGVLSGTKEDSWIAAPGFVMQADGSAKWQANLKHPKYQNIVSTKKIFHWLPVKDYYWKNSNPKSLEAANAATIIFEKMNNNNRRRYR